MSLFDYHKSLELVAEDVPFYALIMAAMRKADTDNERFLRDAWPEIWDELKARYNSPGGKINDSPRPGAG